MKTFDEITTERKQNENVIFNLEFEIKANQARLDRLYAIRQVLDWTLSTTNDD